MPAYSAVGSIGGESCVTEQIGLTLDTVRHARQALASPTVERPEQDQTNAKRRQRYV
jgi:hypothetical protein